MKQRIIANLLDKKVMFGVWVLVGLLTALKQYSLGEVNSHINNYIIFKSSFWHLLEGKNLYLHYPKEYVDLFLYGPAFTVLIAPFAALPTIFGVSLWNVFNSVILLYAIYQLPLFSDRTKAIMAWICLNSCITGLLNVQFHGVITAAIMLSYSNIKKGDDFWGAFWIVLGTMTKIYGVVGLAFFFFSKKKLNLIFCGIAWTIVLFMLPMLFSSPSYIVQAYQDWYATLTHKNEVNTVLNNPYQDICVMGMARRITGDATLSNLYFVIPAMLTLGVSYLRIHLFQNTRFQLLLLASVLLIVVLASSGTEASTLLIGFVGVAIWFLQSKRGIVERILFFITLLIASFGPTDVIPRFIRDEYLRKYALMVLPMLLVWIKIQLEIWGVGDLGKKAERYEGNETIC